MFRALVDTGSSQTLVRQECLKDAQTLYKGSLKVRCIHGDEREYPTVDLEMQIDGQGYFLTVGVVDKALYSVVLGRDIPILADLLQDREDVADIRVVTRAQSRQLSYPLPFAETPKERKTRREKRQRKIKGTVIVEDLPKPSDDSLEVIPHDMVELQRQDVSLKPLFAKVGSKDLMSVVSDKDQFLLKDERLYRQSSTGEQLVVPTSLRSMVLKLGHSTPWAGHLGQQKTLARVSNRFYWPRQYMDVMEFCL